MDKFIYILYEVFDESECYMGFFETEKGAEKVQERIEKIYPNQYVLGIKKVQLNKIMYPDINSDLEECEKGVQKMSVKLLDLLSIISYDEAIRIDQLTGNGFKNVYEGHNKDFLKSKPGEEIYEKLNQDVYLIEVGEETVDILLDEEYQNEARTQDESVEA